MAGRSSAFELTLQHLRDTVRETSRSLGKDVRLHVEGDAHEWNDEDLSRLREALAHAVRNAIDHGIESPKVRSKSGKNPVGRIDLRFASEENATVVTVEDDGAGVDLDAVSRKAARLGLVVSTEALAARESLALLFEPGFSTKKTVTEISGRGIGLDLVQSVAISFGGAVEIDTAHGKGTKLVLRLPRKKPAKAA